MNKYNQLFAEVMMASYLYYHKDTIIMTDQEYDEKAIECRQNWKHITHKYKKLVKLKDFRKKTSLYYIKERDYPAGLKRIALKWKDLVKTSHE